MEHMFPGSLITSEINSLMIVVDPKLEPQLNCGLTFLSAGGLDEKVN